MEDPIFTHGSDTFNLIIQNNGKRMELGPCRIIPESRDDEYSGRLIFLADVYDMHSLLFEDKVVKLQSAFCDLPLILARRNLIKQSFKEFTTNLTYDLNVYKRLFDDLDLKCQEEPETIRDSVQTAVIKTEGQKFKQFLDEKLNELELLVEDFSQEEHQCHGFYFRKQLWNFLLCCPLMARTNLKPRGYSGDSEIMRMIYSNDYEGESTFSKLLNKHGVEHAAAQSVRNRVALIVQTLFDFQESPLNCSMDKLKILSVGCGPAFEIQEILRSSHDCNNYHFALLDQDPIALSEAARLVKDIDNKLNTKTDVDYIQGSVRTMIFSKSLKQKWGQFHFIYSMGLFDYLSNPVASAVIKKLCQLLKPGGEMIVGNFHVSNPSKYYMEYWCDWVLHLRKENEFRNLLGDDSPVNASVVFENTGSQMFLHIKKQADG
jgi:extracellular factor (EF) 3-hydroxypalmitic acid methyl ester biosynthesis protein